MGPVHVPEVLHVAEKGDGLKRFAETHLVGKDAVDAVLIQGDHPVETADLVVSHFAMLDVMRRLVEAENTLFGLVKVSEQLLVFLLLRHPMTVVALLAPFPAKSRRFSHCTG